jgi:hypothetical protein
MTAEEEGMHIYSQQRVQRERDEEKRSHKKMELKEDKEGGGSRKVQVDQSGRVPLLITARSRKSARFKSGERQRETASGQGQGDATVAPQRVQGPQERRAAFKPHFGLSHRSDMRLLIGSTEL